MIIKKYIEFIEEAISGTEIPSGPGGSFGPAYGETRLQNKTIDFYDTKVILSGIDNKFYTVDEYNELYNNYLKSGGTPFDSEFNKENLDKILYYFK